MTFGLISTGFNLKTLGDILGEVEDYQRLHVCSGLILGADSDQGQINYSICLEISKVWELMQAMYAAFDPDAANDWSLDRVASLTGTLRSAYSKTTVTGQVTLNPNKNLPAGSVANLTGRPNTRFLTTVEVPATVTGGTYDVVFEAEEYGPIDVEIGQLDEINVAVSGWTAVNNSAAGAPGAEPEEDPDFRDKRERELEASGSTNLNAIIAGVSRVTGVVDVTGSENDKSIVQNGLPPNSVAIVVRGGADADIAEAIFEEKAAGITTFGTTTEQVTDSENVDHDISFTKASALTFYCDVEVETNEDWDGATSIANIKALIAAYVNALGVGDDVIYAKVSAAVLEEPGVADIATLYIAWTASPAGTSNLAVAASEYATADVANIGVTTV